MAREKGVFPPSAPQPDILRASEKDEFYKSQLSNDVVELLSKIFGPRFVMRRGKELKVLSQICYYSLTTLIGQQTLGEEYCDLLLVKERTSLPPSVLTRVLLIAGQVLLPYYYEKFVSKFPQFNYPEMKATLERLHLGIFYLSGAYYHLAKRILGIKYVFIRRLDETRPRYVVLGLLIFLQLFISSVRFSISYLSKKEGGYLEVLQDGERMKITNSEQVEENLETSGPQCTLCLNTLSHPTATSCGHMFCWKCIHEAIQLKSECPLCRQQILPHTLLPIYN
eukprot:TRINITY_DN1880_c0_g2_i1.p1 TRINITY_DN1880_c0_g2~~TRINITY_DN1880_c0_g2_i1.p1  ORF type:complete len:297 (+),score=55.99 TRINITY_DN1880_c0_g2_i1:49-891(+)